MKLASAETIATVTREQLVEVMANGYASRLSLDELKEALASLDKLLVIASENEPAASKDAPR